MGQVLDSIVKKKILEGPQTVNSDLTSDSVDISGVDSSYSIQIKWNSGVTVDIDATLEVSVDGVSFVSIADTLFNFTTDDDVAIWEVTGRGINFVRVNLVVNTGSIILEYIELSGVRSH